MIAWLLWFFLALHLFLLDGLLAGLTDVVPDLSLAVALFCSLYARSRALPGLLLCAALSRSVLMEGNAALHLLILGVPVAVLLPLRSVFSRGSVLWPCLASGFLAFVMPRLSGLLFRLTGDGGPALPMTGFEIFIAMCAIPVFTLALRSLPPLSLFQEDGP
jgi:hypothetical protein